MTEIKTDHAAEAESYLRDLDSLDAADAFVAVTAAQVHSNLAQLEPAREMVELQRRLLASMLPTRTDDGAASPPANTGAANTQAAESATAKAAPSSPIEEQIKPAIEEPLAFGSVVKVRSGTLYVRLGAAQALPWGSGEQLRGWDQMDVEEVLRIGIGEPPS